MSAWIRVLITTNDPNNVEQFKKYKALIDRYLVSMARKYLGKNIYIKESVVGHDPAKNIYYLRVLIEDKR